jgi:hypothetical protein
LKINKSKQYWKFESDKKCGQHLKPSKKERKDEEKTEKKRNVTKRYGTVPKETEYHQKKRNITERNSALAKETENCHTKKQR